MMEASSDLNKLGYSIDLPCGFFSPHKDGFSFFRDGMIRGMKGRLYTELGNPKYQNNPSVMQQIIVQQCLVSLGGRPMVNQMFDTMLVADQNYIVMQVRKITKGETIVGRINCLNTACNEQLEIDLDIDKFEVIRLDEPTDEDIKRGYRTFTIEDPDIKMKAVYRYPTIGDYNKSSNLMKKNLTVAQNVITMGCLLELYVNDVKLREPYNQMFFDDLDTNIIESLVENFKEKQPGPIMETSVECYLCGHKSPITIGDTDFLARHPKKPKTT